MAGPRRADPVWAVVGVWAVALTCAAAVAVTFVVRGLGTRSAALAAEPSRSPAPTQIEVEITSTPPPTATGPPTAVVHTSTIAPVESATASSTPTPYYTPTSVLTPTYIWAAHPEYADVTVIGYSVGGRPLEVFRFGAGEIERMIIAGIHGGYEWNTIALADELIAHLQQHPEVIPPDVTLFILRSLNPDGEARAQGVNGRANENGVDLNRNWPSGWQPDWPRDGCWKYTPVTGGAGPGSEPETQALMNFLLQSRVDALINYHSAVLGIFPGGQPPDEASLRLAEAVAAASPYPYPPIDTGCQFTGQLIDWASDGGIAALDIELRNHRDTDFEINLAILSVLLEWRR